MLPEVMLVGLAGSDPARKPSGSDQMPCQKLNDTPPSPATMDDRNAAEVCAGLPLVNDPAAATVVPGATTRSCRTACGSAWPAKAANAAPTVAATSVVSAAAASTTQCAVIRRTASGPRRFVTRSTIPHPSTRCQIRSGNESAHRLPGQTASVSLLMGSGGAPGQPTTPAARRTLGTDRA